MLKENLVPTRLIPTAERRAVITARTVAPPRLRELHIVVRLVALALGLAWLRLVRRYTDAEAGRRTRVLLERLGGLWIKVGQILSLRLDLFPQAFCAELRRLQDQATGFPPEEAFRILEAELGRPLHLCFSEIEEHPHAAASTAQVHRARLLEDGVLVAVKVQRPHVAESVRREMKVFARLVRAVEVFGVASHMRWRGMMHEIEQIMVEELDFRYEASNLARMAKTLRHHHIHVPVVFSRFSTARVLVTEFVEGVLMSDYIQVAAADPHRLLAWLAENDVEPDRVGRRLVTSLLRQTFEDNLYHGDLHPGNIMLLRESRVALIDLGTVGVTDGDFLAKYYVFMRALGEGSFAKAADTLLLLGSNVPPARVDDMREELVRAMRSWTARTYVQSLPYHEKSVSTVAAALVRILASYQSSPDWAFLRVLRAEQTLDASLIHLMPGSNYTKLLGRYVRRAERRRLRSLGRDGRLAAKLWSALGAGASLAEDAVETSALTAATVRREALSLEATTGKAAYALELVCRHAAAMLLFGAVMLGVAYLGQHHPAWLPWGIDVRFAAALSAIPRLDPLWWIALLAIDLYLWRLMRRLGARFGAKEATRA